MTVPLRKLRRTLRSPVSGDQPHRSVRRAAYRAENLVMAYYVASVYLAAQLIYEVQEFSLAMDNWDLLWPIAWAARFDVPLVAELLTVGSLFASLAALQFRRHWMPRAAFALLFFLAATIVNSTGGINHPYHAWIWVGAILVFLPDGRVSKLSRAGRLSYLSVFLTAQVMFMLFYSMAGLWKVVLGVQSTVAGLPGNFSFQALSWTIADRSVQTGSTPLLADLIIYYPAIAWPAFVAVMYVQVFAVIAALRPRLSVSWGYALIAFHIGTWLSMEIIFTQHVLLLVILMVLTPFAPARASLWDRVADLPLFGGLAGLIARPYPQSAERRT